MPENIDYINQLVDYVYALSTSLEEKEAALKVLQCLQYIYHNQEHIQQAIQDRLEKKPWKFAYRKDDIIDDYDQGILRDNNRTSFHISDFLDGKSACHLLNYKIKEFNNTLSLLPKSRWRMLIKQFGDGGTKGCLEARIRPAMQWMHNQLRGNFNLYEIIEECDFILGNEGCHQPSLQQITTFALQYCKNSGITQCDQGTITQELLIKYIRSLEIYNEESELNNQKGFPKTFSEVTTSAKVVVGHHGMIQYHFPLKQQADYFLSWLQKQDTPILDIQKAAIKHENSIYIVRLTEEQCAILHSIEEASKSVASISTSSTLPLELVENQDEIALLADLENIFSQKIDRKLSRQHDNHVIILHGAFYYASDDTLLALIEEASPQVIDDALGKLNNDQSTGLHVACSNTSEKVLLALLEKASQQAIDKALVKKTDEQWTALHTAFYHTSKNVLLTLLERASPQAINEALGIQAENNGTCLHIAFCNASEKVLLKLLKKASAENIGECLKIKIENKKSTYPLFSLTSREINKSTLLLVEKLPAELLEDILTSQPINYLLTNIFENAASPTIVFSLLKAFFEKTSFNTFNNLFGIKSPYLIQLIFSSLLKIDLVSNKNLLAKLHETLVTLFIILPELKTMILERWFESGNIPAYLASHLALDSNTREPTNWLEIAWIKSEDPKVSYCEEKSAANIFKSGISSQAEYQYYRKKQNSDPHLRYVLDELRKSALLLTGTGLDLHDYLIHHPAPDYYLKPVDAIERKIKSNQVLIKVVKEKNLPALLNSLLNYKQRPPLRIPIDSATVTHKFFHLSGEVKPYLKIRKPGIQHLDTKKTSTTLLPTDMSSVIFGEKHTSTPLVALMFDQSKCRIKAMLKYDRGTFKREWVGTEETVSDYIKSLNRSHLNFTDIAKFQAHVNQSSSVNEVLACLSRDALIGIAIAKDTPKARLLAIAYQSDIRTTLGILIPIVFYNRTLGNITTFTSHDEIETKNQLNCLREYSSKSQVMALREKINSKAVWYKKTWLSFLSGGFSEDKTPTKTAEQILDLINQQIKQPSNKSWELLEKTIEAILSKEVQSEHPYRSDDTQSFYQEISRI